MLSFIFVNRPASPDLDFCLELGQLHWLLYCRSRMTQMPSYDYFSRANLLFLGGFSDGFYDGFYAVVNAKSIEEMKNDAWRAFLSEFAGEVLLEGNPYPDVPPSVVAKAKRFFEAGYDTAIAVTSFSAKRE